MRSTTLALSAIALLSAPAFAQQPCLVQKGGALGKIAKWEISGAPASDFYFLLFGVTETPTPIFGLTLDIPIDLFQFSLDVGAFGFTNASGESSFAATLPTDPAFVGEVFRAQAVLGFPLADVSNLTRLPVSAPRTFRDSFGQPSVAAAIAGGAILEGDKGALTFVGGSGAIATTFDPRLEEFSDAIVPFAAPAFTSTTVLADGRILFAGGLNALDGTPTSDAFVYDPVAQTSLALTMNNARLGHTSTLLNDGRVFIAGGLRTIGIDLTDPASLLDINTLLSLANDIQASTEIFDPTTNTFTPAANLPEKRVLHSATKRGNGNVLLAGGVSVIPFLNLPTVSGTSSDYSPGTNSYSFFPAFLGTARAGHEALTLADGSVVLIGGLTADFGPAIASGNPADIVVSSLASIERYTPGTFGGSFANYANLSVGRFLCSGLLLTNGEVLVAGGFELDLSDPLNPLVGASAVADVILGPGSVVQAGDMSDARTLPVLRQLDTGAVLMVGGLAASAEIFQP
ncbi:Kelch motif protein [Planctomycetes bacterium Pla163]|uniref:Kelch motif protein n=1 Tax=Rohdeia mirabilis TaxID=2528008 RepID=A0A518CZ66_9BACT|nr:Kelch motif protein [Planctomycetes bacterium Pla163]